MSVELSELANGLRVVTHRMAHLGTTSLGLWVGAGSRHETEAEHGASHFLEHMAFKGTRTRSAREIAEEIEAVGGDLNAATGLDTTAYFARVLGGDEGVALGLIADILQNSLFGAEEMEREREVILQEIASIHDSPEEIAFDLVQEAAFPGQAIGRPVIGTAKTVGRLTARDLKALLELHYRPNNMVISAAGAASHKAILRHAEALFGGLTGGRIGTVARATYVGGVRASAKSFEQSHVVLGFEGPRLGAADYFAAQVYSGLMGGGMSSRLFQEAREKRGLCYSIYSSAWALEDTGLFAVHAATGAEVMAKLTGVIGSELVRMAETGPEEAEVARTKAQLKAGLLMSLESSTARAEQMARHLLVHGRLIPKEELIERVEAVTGSEVQEFGARLLERKPSAAVAGAGRRSAALAGAVAASIGR